MRAKGIPDRNNFGDVDRIPKRSEIVVQRHDAERAGTHFDIRLKSKDGLISWSSRKGLPEDRPRLVIRQPLHSTGYKNFQGEIKEGYGKGNVKLEMNQPVTVDNANDHHVSFEMKDGRKYRMVKPKNFKPNQWLMSKVAYKFDEAEHHASRDESDLVNSDTSKIKIKKSKIQGNGVFTTQAMKPGDLVGLGIEFIAGMPMRTLISRYINHSKNPNVILERQGGQRYFLISKPVKHNEELTLDYTTVEHLEKTAFRRRSGSLVALMRSLESKAEDKLIDKATNKARDKFESIAYGREREKKGAYYHYVDPDTIDSVKQHGIMGMGYQLKKGTPEQRKRMQQHAERYRRFLGKGEKPTTENLVRAIRMARKHPMGDNKIYLLQEKVDLDKGNDALKSWMHGKVPVQVDVDALKRARQLIASENLDAAPIDYDKLGDKIVFKDIPHPNILTRSGRIDPIYLKVENVK